MNRRHGGIYNASLLSVCGTIYPYHCCLSPPGTWAEEMVTFKNMAPRKGKPYLHKDLRFGLEDCPCMPTECSDPVREF